MPSLETLPSPPLSQFWASTAERCILSAPHCKQRLPLSHFPPHCTQFLLPRCHHAAHPLTPSSLGLAEQNPAVPEHVPERGISSPALPSPLQSGPQRVCPRGSERTAWGRFYFSDLDQLTPPAKLHLLFCGQVNLQVSPLILSKVAGSLGLTCSTSCPSPASDWSSCS